MDGLQGKTLLELMTWGYHYFWKHPYVEQYMCIVKSISIYIYICIYLFLDAGLLDRLLGVAETTAFI